MPLGITIAGALLNSNERSRMHYEENPIGKHSPSPALGHAFPVLNSFYQHTLQPDLRIFSAQGC